MATYTKVILSETSNGEALGIPNTASPGTVVHTSSSTSGDLDEIWIWVTNKDVSNNVVTVEFGGSNEGNRIQEKVEPSKTILIIPGIPLVNGANVKIYSDSGNISAFGYVNRRTTW